jgi:tetratricopeptide (TPR) repeat protein
MCAAWWADRASIARLIEVTQHEMRGACRGGGVIDASAATVQSTIMTVARRLEVRLSERAAVMAKVGNATARIAGKTEGMRQSGGLMTVTAASLGASIWGLIYGHREEALAASQEAVDIHRRLAQTRPDAFLPDLATSLNNLGNRLSNLGRREEALAASQEAVDIYRRLAQTRPDAFLPYLATSLNNLGGDLSNLGRREEALAASQEAVDIRRRLAQTRPDAFLPDLATSISVMSDVLAALDRHGEAGKRPPRLSKFWRHTWNAIRKLTGIWHARLGPIFSATAKQQDSSQTTRCLRGWQRRSALAKRSRRIQRSRH